jgi:hypothetical protein
MPPYVINSLFKNLIPSLVGLIPSAIESVIEYFDLPKTPVLPPVNGRKPYCTVKLTDNQKAYVTQQYKLWKITPDRIPMAKFIAQLNKDLKCNKTYRAYRVIWTGKD